MDVQKEMNVMDRELAKDGGDCALAIGPPASPPRAQTLID